MRNWNDNSKITFIWLSVCLWLGGTGARAQHCHRSLRRLGSSLDTESERLCLPLPLKDATAPPPPLPRPPTSINYSPLSPPILPLHCSSCPNKINTFFLICFRRFQFFLSRLEWQPLLLLAFSFWLNFKHKFTLRNVGMSFPSCVWFWIFEENYVMFFSLRRLLVNEYTYLYCCCRILFERIDRQLLL